STLCYRPCSCAHRPLHSFPTRRSSDLCMDDIFPAHSAVEKWKLGMEEEMEEEARLFYVACTRARKRLVLPYANFSANTPAVPSQDRKSTRLNSSHVSISYAVFCLKKKR